MKFSFHLLLTVIIYEDQQRQVKTIIKEPKMTMYYESVCIKDYEDSSDAFVFFIFLVN